MVRIILLLLFAGARAQNSFIVADAQTREPLPFATIRQGDAGVYSDANGRVEAISFKAGQPVEISMMGYGSISLNRETIGDTVNLMVEPIPLLEVKVPSGKREVVTVKPPPAAGLMGSWPLGAGNETIAVLFPHKGDRKIRKISIPFAKARDADMLKFEGQPVFRLNVYKVSGTEKGDWIYSTEPTSIGNNKRNLLEIDLSAEDIYLGSEGICLGLEMVGNLLPDGTLAKGVYYLSPFLTGRENKYFAVSTYLKNVFYSSKPVPITTFINDHMPPGVVVPERNLAIGLVLQ